MMPLCAKHPKRMRFERVAKVAKALGIDELKLLDVAEHTSKLYDPFPKKKLVNGVEKKRTIDNPQTPLKDFQRQIYVRLLRDLPASAIAYGGVPNRSHIDAAKSHCRQRFVATLDIQGFFQFISYKQVYQVFIDLGCAPDVARLLTMLLTKDGHLPQGSATSTAIANLVLYDFDARLYEFAAYRGCVVTRVVDDIAISGVPAQVGEVVDYCFRQLHGLGFQVNRSKKLRFMPAFVEQSITGVTVNGISTSVPKHYRERLRSDIRRYARYGGTPRELMSIEGRMSYIAQVNPRQAEALRATLK